MRHNTWIVANGKWATIVLSCTALMAVLQEARSDAQIAPAPDVQVTNSAEDANIQLLVQALVSDDSRVRSEALRGLHEIKVTAAPALLALLADENAPPEKRGYAARALSYGLPSVIEAIPTLVRILEDKSQDPNLRSRVAWSLDSTIQSNLADVQLSAEPEKVIRPDTSSLLPVLIDLLKDASEGKEIRSHAAFALGGLGPDAHPALPVLIASIKDSEPRVRSASASAIGDIGREMPEVVPVLISVLRDEDENVRDWTAAALGKHKGTSGLIVQALRESLEGDGSPSVRQSCVMALIAIGPDTEGVVPALVLALRDEHDWVRGEATSALGKVGPVAPEVIPALIAALDDQNAEVKWYAARALGSFGPKARDAIPALTRAILTDYRRSEAYYCEDTIVQALRDIGADMTSVVPSLAMALKSDDVRARRQAAWALAAIGSEGLPALADALTMPGLREENELSAELSMIDYPLDSTPNLSPEGLQALIHHYIRERDRQAASTPDKPERWEREQNALLYLAKLEREQKAKADAAARDGAEVGKFILPPTLLAFVAPALVALVMLVLKLHRRSRSSIGV